MCEKPCRNSTAKSESSFRIGLSPFWQETWSKNYIFAIKRVKIKQKSDFYIRNNDKNFKFTFTYPWYVEGLFFINVPKVFNVYNFKEHNTKGFQQIFYLALFCRLFSMWTKLVHTSIHMKHITITNCQFVGQKRYAVFAQSFNLSKRHIVIGNMFSECKAIYLFVCIHRLSTKVWL